MFIFQPNQVFLNNLYFNPFLLGMVTKTIKKTAIIGFISKGLVYLVMGVLSLLAALNMGGKSSGTKQALLFFKKQPWGQFLLTALGVGLLCYSFWMMVRSIRDPEEIGLSLKAILMRIGFFVTAIIYALIAILAFYYLFNPIDNMDQINSLNFMNPSMFSIIFIGTGVVLIAQAGVLMWAIYNGRLLNQFHLTGTPGSQIMKIGGNFGFYARAFVTLIIAYFFLRAGIYSGNQEIKGIQDAFSFLDKSFLGRILMVFTSIGFISYGLFYILLSKYRTFMGEEN